MSETKEAEPIAGLVCDWKTPEDAWRRGDRAWLPCSEAFYDEMLGVLPPIYCGPCFAVSEAWRHDAQGRAVYLWFRHPTAAAFVCRMAREDEIKAELQPPPPVPTPPTPPPGPEDPAHYRGDIPHSAAYAAHSGTSWTPEKRADSTVNEYGQEMAHTYKDLAAKCRNNSERATLAAFWPRYRSIMRQLNLEYLGSRNGIVSAFIAGPSNFPSRRMEKRNRWADNKLNHLFEVKARLLKRINRDLRPELRPIMAGDSDAVQRLKDKIAKAEQWQERMKQINKAVRKVLNLPQDQRVAKLAEALKEMGHNGKTPLEHVADNLLRPDFAGRIGMPGYELTNNNANIRRMRERLESITQAKAEPMAQAEGKDGITFEDVPAENRVKLFFPGKPSSEIRERLKRSGFRWAPSEGCWKAYRNTGTLATARAEAGI